jgi:hypothetical protein
MYINHAVIMLMQSVVIATYYINTPLQSIIICIKFLQFEFLDLNLSCQEFLVLLRSWFPPPPDRLLDIDERERYRFSILDVREAMFEDCATFSSEENVSNEMEKIDGDKTDSDTDRD